MYYMSAFMCCMYAPMYYNMLHVCSNVLHVYSNVLHVYYNVLHASHVYSMFRLYCCCFRNRLNCIFFFGLLLAALGVLGYLLFPRIPQISQLSNIYPTTGYIVNGDLSTFPIIKTPVRTLLSIGNSGCWIRCQCINCFC